MVIILMLFKFVVCFFPEGWLKLVQQGYAQALVNDNEPRHFCSKYTVLSMMK